MKYIIANWKMYFEYEEVEAWLRYFKADSKHEIIIAPSFPFLNLVTKHKVAAQDISEHEEGSFTGSVSANQIVAYCKYCIVGHSEINDSLEVKIKKMDVCIANKITPIVCFKDLSELNSIEREGVLLVWEDPENISKNGEFEKVDLELTRKTYSDIRKLVSPTASVLYGGSVNRQNIQELVKMGIDGVLVGHASIDPTHFVDIVRAFDNVD